MRVSTAIAVVAMITGAPARDASAEDARVDGTASTFEALAEAAAACAPTAVEAMVAAIPGAASPRAAADALFATARTCEIAAGDPARALALYEQIVRDHPDERVAGGAATRRDALIALIGRDGSGAAFARRFDALKQRGGLRPDDAVLAEAAALAREAWPGAGEVALWRGEALRRIGSLAAAAAAYDDVVDRFPATTGGARAAEGGAAVAIMRHRWDDAERRIARLPATARDDRAVRDGLRAQLATERRRARWHLAAWIGLAAAVALLIASLVHAARTPRLVVAALRPPIEVVYAAPVVAILLAAAATSHIEIGPAVAVISGGGLAIAWLSGAGLAAARRGGGALGWRVAGHVALTVIAVAGLAYVAITRHALLEMIAETVRFGPEP